MPFSMSWDDPGRWVTYRIHPNPTGKCCSKNIKQNHPKPNMRDVTLVKSESSPYLSAVNIVFKSKTVSTFEPRTIVFKSEKSSYFSAPKLCFLRESSRTISSKLSLICSPWVKTPCSKVKTVPSLEKLNFVFCNICHVCYVLRFHHG